MIRLEFPKATQKDGEEDSGGTEESLQSLGPRRVRKDNPSLQLVLNQSSAVTQNYGCFRSNFVSSP